MSSSILVRDQMVGEGHECYIVMELGVTHEGDLGLAKEMILAASEAGANAVKVECIIPNLLVAQEYQPKLDYSFTTYSGKDIKENYYKLLQRLSLSMDEIAQLKEYADTCNIAFFGTAFDIVTIDFLKSIGSCAIKISSGEISHYPLLIKAARSELPVFMDTGRANMTEICSAVEVLRLNGCDTPIVMHNPSGYPCAPENVNLPVIQRYKRILDIPVGLACHSRGNEMVLGALALGANLIEKPISRDNTIEDDEHIFSVNINQVSDYVKQIRTLEKGLIYNREKLFPRVNDSLDKNKFRQSIVATVDLKPGDKLTTDAYSFARPGYGIEPKLADKIADRLVIREVRKGELIQWEHLLCTNEE
ncbi:TPA: N-acetylneuraminate synthase family protein [Legionella pneumophila]|uniref:N-acetylneuraminate synthase family protein n=1 Tax=Legionella pneumophila TaxID=446 RepID=UPI0004862531|nr:N-acetylneuraminate synthase family protein [Legionella pneumophila]BCL64508.1 N-acetylneuraminate synthase [Legionella pneumophila serogroup 11]VEB29547.1 N-acetylneuraminic acid synthetase [Legionella pneumophila]HAT1942969.1 hypothetical protein [Legionella pneumophila]HAT8690672.1 hypothetical protein [Legionella pneumophila]HAT8728060.1 hypothetical protein [Legionella pneumophila]